MNNLFKYILSFVVICLSYLSIKAQDIPVIQMTVGASSNVSLLSNKIKNVGGYFSLEYFISRNIFAGVQADYLVAQNTIQCTNPAFDNAVIFPGDTLELKENISKLNVGIYGGYKFFPLNDLSINLAACVQNIGLDRKFKSNGVLNDDATAWYQNNWSTNNATTIGVSASFDLVINKTTMLRTGVNYQDITNSLFNNKDQHLVKEIGYIDGKINSLTYHQKTYQSMDVFMALVFKLGLKKL
jgi:hypothetical protein